MTVFILLAIACAIVSFGFAIRATILVRRLERVLSRR